MKDEREERESRRVKRIKMNGKKKKKNEAFHDRWNSLKWKGSGGGGTA